MLVKLGNVWVNPNTVDGIETSERNGQIVFNVVTEKRSYTSYPNPEQTIDSYAAIINTAGQSFGGDDNEKPKEE